VDLRSCGGDDICLVVEMMILHFLTDIRLHLDNAVKDLALTLSPNIMNASRRASPIMLLPVSFSFWGGIGSLAIGGSSMTLMTVNVQFAGDRSESPP
jgi:hypothetical protein